MIIYDYLNVVFRKQNSSVCFHDIEHLQREHLQREHLQSEHVKREHLQREHLQCFKANFL